MALQAVFFLLLAALSCNSAHKLGKLKTHKTGGLTISGGTPVKISEVPFVARLVHNVFGPTCGATIINKKFLLTTADCATSDLSVFVGSDNLDSGDKYEIKQFHMHPHYTRCWLCFSSNFNIAVIELATNLTFGEKVQPIALNEPDVQIADDTIFEFLGFGFTENMERSHVLLKVDLPYVPADECGEAWKLDDAEVTDDMICAGGTTEKAPCYGDNGGPLVYKNRLIGMASNGYGCILEGVPVLFTRVSAFRSFINGIVN